MGKEKTTFLFLSGVNTKTCSLSYADAKISLSFSSTLFQMEPFFYMLMKIYFYGLVHELYTNLLFLH